MRSFPTAKAVLGFPFEIPTPNIPVSFGVLQDTVFSADTDELIVVGVPYSLQGIAPLNTLSLTCGPTNATTIAAAMLHLLNDTFFTGWSFLPIMPIFWQEDFWICNQCGGTWVLVSLYIFCRCYLSQTSVTDLTPMHFSPADCFDRSFSRVLLFILTSSNNCNSTVIYLSTVFRSKSMAALHTTEPFNHIMVRVA